MSRLKGVGALGALKLIIRSSMLERCLSAVSCWRDGVEVSWALLEAKRDVRAEGVVGVPFFMSRAPSRMREMSWLAVVDCAGESGCSGLFFEEASSACLVRREVAKAREVVFCMGFARQCLETNDTLAAGWRYAVGARKGMRDCEERIIVSPALMGCRRVYENVARE